MSSQYYRGYKIDVSCMKSEGRYGYRVRIAGMAGSMAPHACDSEAREFANSNKAADAAFYYARAWIDSHPLPWPFAAPP
jgi:hypothetical protein